jgi:hypothetical protein
MKCPILNATIRSNPMKTKLVLGAVAAAVAMFSQGAFAQAASAPTRAEVKADARKGALAPAGQGQVAAQPSKSSDKTRDERKATTRADKSAGALKPAGEGAEMKDDKAEKMKGGQVNRAERKADTKAAVKAHKTQPAGEAPQPSAEAPKK